MPTLQAKGKQPSKRDLRIEDALANMSPYELSALEVRVERPPIRASGLPHHFQRDADHLNVAEEQLMELGREELLMREAEVQKKIVVKANNKDRVGLTSVELSYLHQQLQGITTTCTLVIGFAMAALSAELLVALGDDTGQFCLFKSVTASVLSGLFLFLDTTCICVCFTIIASVQIIIYQSQRAIFSRSMVHKVETFIERTRKRRDVRRVNLTPRVVRMTQLLMYGDRSANWDNAKRKEVDAAPKTFSVVGGFSIYIGMGIALGCFFLSTVILIWIFLSPLAMWRHLPADSEAAIRSGIIASGTGNVSNPSLVRTYGGGQYKAQCLDPHSESDEQRRELVGLVLCSVSTLVFLINVLVGFKIGRQTMERYSLDSLLMLPEEELELMDVASGDVASQVLEHDDDADAEEESYRAQAFATYKPSRSALKPPPSTMAA